MKKKLPNYYTVNEIADSFGVTMLTIRNLIKKLGINIVRIGGSIRIPESEIDKFKEDN